MLQYLTKLTKSKSTQNKLSVKEKYAAVKYKSNQVKRQGKSKYTKRSNCMK